MKILNLYAGIGGNRKLWGDNHQITSIEYNPQIAAVYKDLFPNDMVIVTDAHEFLLNHYKEFDFIWSSPPCQTHSQMRQNLSVGVKGSAPQYPDMKLYQEIIFLKYNCKTSWVVENVRPYYEPLIKPQTIQRHLFWSNKEFQELNLPPDNLRVLNKISDVEALHGFDLSKYGLPNKRQVLRNCVNPILGLHILNCIDNG